MKQTKLSCLVILLLTSFGWAETHQVPGGNRPVVSVSPVSTTPLSPAQNEMIDYRSVATHYYLKDNQDHGTATGLMYAWKFYNANGGMNETYINGRIVPLSEHGREKRLNQLLEEAKIVGGYVGKSQGGASYLDLTENGLSLAGKKGQMLSTAVKVVGDGIALNEKIYTENALYAVFGKGWEKQVKSPINFVTAGELKKMFAAAERDPAFKKVLAELLPDGPNKSTFFQMTKDDFRGNPSVSSHLTQQEIAKELSKPRSVVDEKKVDQWMNSTAELNSNVKKVLQMLEEGQHPVDLEKAVNDYLDVKASTKTAEEKKQKMQNIILAAKIGLDIWDTFGPQDRDTKVMIAVGAAGLKIATAMVEGGAAGSLAAPGFGTVAGALAGLVSSIHQMDQNRAAAKASARTQRALFRQLAAIRTQIQEIYKALSSEIANNNANNVRAQQMEMAKLNLAHRDITEKLNRIENTLEAKFSVQAQAMERLFQQSRDIQDDVLNGNKANQDMFADQQRQKEVEAVNKLHIEALESPFPLPPSEVSEIQRSTDKTRFNRFKDSMNVFKNNAVLFKQGPIATGYSVPLTGDSVNRLLAKHLAVTGRTSNIAILSDGLKHFGVLAEPVVAAPNRNPSLALHERFYSGSSDVFGWIRNAEQYYNQATKIRTAQHPKYWVYEKDYMEYDPELKNLAEVLDAGHRERLALEAMLPLDSEGKPALYQLKKLFHNYEDRLEEAARRIKGHRVGFAKNAPEETRYYKLGVSIANQDLPSKAMVLPELEDGILPCPEYSATDKKKKSLETLPVLNFPSPEIFMGLLRETKEALAARHLFGGEFNFCYADIVSRKGKLQVTIRATLTSPGLMTPINVFERTVTDDSPAHEKGVYFNSDTMVEKFAERWNGRDAVLRNRLALPESALKENRKEEKWNQAYLTKTVDDYLSQAANFSKTSKDQEVVQGASVPVEDALTDLEGARLLLTHGLGLLYQDEGMALKLAELPGKRELVEEVVQEGENFSEGKFRNGSQSLMDYMRSDERKGIKPMSAIINDRLVKLEDLYSVRAARQNLPLNQRSFDSSRYSLQTSEKDKAIMAQNGKAYERLSKEFGIRSASLLFDSVVANSAKHPLAQTEEDLVHFMRNFSILDEKAKNTFLSNSISHGVPSKEIQASWLASHAAALAVRTSDDVAKSKFLEVVLSNKDFAEKTKLLSDFVAERTEINKRILALQSEIDREKAGIIRAANKGIKIDAEENQFRLRNISGTIIENLWISKAEKEEQVEKYKKVPKWAAESEANAKVLTEILNRMNQSWSSMDVTALEKMEIDIKGQSKLADRELARIVELQEALHDKALEMRQGEVKMYEMHYYGEPARYEKLGNVWIRDLRKHPLEDGEAYLLRKEIPQLRSRANANRDELNKLAKKSPHYSFRKRIAENSQNAYEKAQARLDKLLKWQSEVGH